MLPGQQTIVCSNPFRYRSSSSTSSENGSSDTATAEKAFLEFFELCVVTEDDAEEQWALDRLKAIYVAAIVAADDRCPSFFEALSWGAQATAGAIA